MINDLKLEFDESGLIPAIVQDSSTGEVLMLAYMDEEALRRTVETGRSWFWSRSRKQYWEKGATSGNFQNVKEIRYDCDLDALLLLVEPLGHACHTGERSCFFRRIGEPKGEASFLKREMDSGLSGELDALYEVIIKRKISPAQESYTASLFKAGQDRILAKIKEESDEVIDAAKNKDDPEVVWESADLIYHLLVLLADKGIELSDIRDELVRRKR